MAIIPARGGSKGIASKNLMTIEGRSLVARAVTSCRRATSISAVMVSTDDAEIAGEARSAGADVIDRPAALATDTAASETALLHGIDQLQPPPDITVFVQATSPFIDPAAIDAAVRRVAGGEVDVVFSAVPTHDFIWRLGDDDMVTGLNHDASVRLRRQDRRPDWRETGAFYVMDTAGFVAAQHRFFGRVGVQSVASEHAIEIDDLAQLELARLVADRSARPRPPTCVPLPHYELKEHHL